MERVKITGITILKQHQKPNEKIFLIFFNLLHNRIKDSGCLTIMNNTNYYSITGTNNKELIYDTQSKELKCNDEKLELAFREEFLNARFHLVAYKKYLKVFKKKGEIYTDIYERIEV